uniref:Nanog homeobox n=1 Tax=Sphaeramia orbicularis TaxID=375764 RepID=A0A673B303_9TELE
MADWKTQISYNYNQSYAYAYGLMYPPGPEQTNGNLTGWTNGGLTDLNSFNAGVNQAYYATPARTQEETPPESPEEASFNGLYPNSGLVYFGDTQTSRLLLTGPPRDSYEVHENEGRRAGSDTASDNSEHASPSPDSWSSGSGSSQESSLPHADPATWVTKNLNDEADPAMWVKKEIKSEVDNRSPDATVEVSSSLKKDPQTFAAMGNETADTTTSSPQASMTAQKNPNSNPKGKVRVAFTESQMDVLHTRFNVQRYLTPAEMKQLAEVTGLTYKQVKTWFQNRRMKLRRHQKDKNWVSERYAVHKSGPVGGPVFPNYSSHIQPVSTPPLLFSNIGILYSCVIVQLRISAAFKNPPPNLAFYLAAVGSAPGSTTFPNSPQTPSWPVPAVVGPYEYPPSAFNPVIVNTTSQDTSFSKDQEQINRSPLGAATEHNVTHNN